MFTFSTFGEKLAGDSGINRLMADLGDALEAARHNSEQKLYMLGGGNPAHLPRVQAAIRKSNEDLLANPAAYNKAIGDYDAPSGYMPFRESVAALLERECGWPVTAENIVLTNGSQASFFSIFNLFAGKMPDGSKRKILLPLTPEYIGYSDVGIEEDFFYGLPPKIEILNDQQFKYHLDFKALEKVDEPVGAMCASRPTNPSGNVLSDEEIVKLLEVARNKNIPLILDNAYGLPFPRMIFTDATVPAWDDHLIYCMSLSKFGLPAGRTGVVVASKEVAKALGAMNAVLCLSPSKMGGVLLQSLFNNGDIIRLSKEEVNKHYHASAMRAHDALVEMLADLPCLLHKPEGALFLWLWLRDSPLSSEELYQRLKARGVLLIAGQHFFPGLPEDGPEAARVPAEIQKHRNECLRISHAMDEETVMAGIKILSEELHAVYAESASTV